MAASGDEPRIDSLDAANDNVAGGGLSDYVGEREAIRLFRQQGMSLQEAMALWRVLVHADRQARGRD